MHVREPVVLPGTEPQGALRGSGHADPGMPGRVAVAVAGRPGRAGFAKTPSRLEAVPGEARADERVALGRRAMALEEGLVEVAQRLPRLPGIDNDAAAAVRRRARHGEERRGDEPARRRLHHGDGFLSRDQACGNAPGALDQLLHAAILYGREE